MHQLPIKRHDQLLDQSLSIQDIHQIQSLLQSEVVPCHHDQLQGIKKKLLATPSVNHYHLGARLPMEYYTYFYTRHQEQQTSLVQIPTSSRITHPLIGLTPTRSISYMKIAIDTLSPLVLNPH
jgi:hypothetical protein